MEIYNKKTEKMEKDGKNKKMKIDEKRWKYA